MQLDITYTVKNSQQLETLESAIKSLTESYEFGKGRVDVSTYNSIINMKCTISDTERLKLNNGKPIAYLKKAGEDFLSLELDDQDYHIEFVNPMKSETDRKTRLELGSIQRKEVGPYLVHAGTENIEFLVGNYKGNIMECRTSFLRF